MQQTVSAVHHILRSHSRRSECDLFHCLYEHVVMLNHKVLYNQSILPPLTPFFHSHTCDIWFAQTYWSYHTWGGVHKYTHKHTHSQQELLGGLDVTGSCHNPTLMQTVYARVNTHSCCCSLSYTNTPPLSLSLTQTVSILKWWLRRWLFPGRNVLLDCAFFFSLLLYLIWSVAPSSLAYSSTISV